MLKAILIALLCFALLFVVRPIAYCGGFVYGFTRALFDKKFAERYASA